jgi:hypothetical protein
MRLPLLCFYCIAGLFLASCEKIPDIGAVTTGTVKISITNTVNGTPLVLNTGSYTNSFGEQYNVTKFKYYLSNIGMGPALPNPINGSYFLVDQSNPGTLVFNFETTIGSYNEISFLVGVDSTRNVSGAQTGALDPLNDMFWTWSTGYIMAKLEGNSPQSPVVNNKVEYHIGGFSGVNNALREITLVKPVASPAIEVRAGRTTEIKIEADLDAWWQGSFNLKIADNPAVVTPGTLAKNISNNYAGMFGITTIINP